MNRLLGLLLGSALLWAAPASTLAAAATPPRPSVVFVNPGKSGEVFWDLVSDTMRAAAKQLDLDVEILTAERNRRTLLDLGLGVVARAQPPDYLIIVNEESAATPIIVAANAAGIKTFLLSNAFTGTEAKTRSEERRVGKERRTRGSRC